MWLCSILGAYLIGSIPTAYWIAKQLKGIDIREHGSGNVGATNVGRVVGKKAGYTVLVLDFLKGLLPVLLVRFWLFPDHSYLHVAIALAILVGHSRSIFLGFSGGKSAISGLGTVIGMTPLAGLFVALVAALVIKTTRYVSVGSMTAGLSAPVFASLLGYPLAYVLYAGMSGGFVILRHRANITRLIQGTENRLP
jgi:acyl phosphate:glycerol-3-phosphate acyltransferase